MKNYEVEIVKTYVDEVGQGAYKVTTVYFNADGEAMYDCGKIPAFKLSEDITETHRSYSEHKAAFDIWKADINEALKAKTGLDGWSIFISPEHDAYFGATQIERIKGDETK